MSAPCLLLEGVSRQFGGLKAVDAVSLSVAPGERHALIGPNGAGKTTVFNLISGEFLPTAGRIEMFSRDVTRMPSHRRAALGVARTFQITKLFPALTVLENLLIACTALDDRRLAMHRRVTSYADIRERAAQLMESFGLSPFAGDQARTLSYGDQRKLEVALSMAGKPRLLLLDEPMAGLSAGETRAMHELLDRIDPSVAVLLIEHDMDVAFAFAERVTVLHQGRVLTQGSRESVSRDPRVQQIYLGEGQ
jgi:branched-chain amino acid transport system ATP-binding protein